MFKISFKKNFKKVETFNDRATIVTLTGKMILPHFIEDCLPTSIWEWINNHPSVEVSESYLTQYHCLVIKVQGKSVCAEDDTFDAKTGERIAESRAKIRLYKFMQTLMYKLSEYYTKILTGNEYMELIDYYNNNSLSYTWRKYIELLNHERHHLNELLQKTV
jgi:hypothetical protein